MVKMQKTARILSVLITLITITLIIYGLVNVKTIKAEVSDQIDNYGIPAVFVLSALLDLIPQFISPVVVMATAITIGTNPYLTIIITILGSALGSYIGFTIGQKYLFEAVDAMASKKSIDKLTHLINKYGKTIVPIAAVSPLPYVPVLLGALKFSKRNFVLYGIIPRAISIIFFGYLAHLF